MPTYIHMYVGARAKLDSSTRRKLVSREITLRLITSCMQSDR